MYENKLFVSSGIRIGVLLTAFYAPAWCSDDEYKLQPLGNNAVYTQRVPCDEDLTVAQFKHAVALAFKVKQEGTIKLVFNSTDISNSPETLHALGIVNASHIDVIINKGNNGRPKKVKQ